MKKKRNLIIAGILFYLCLLFALVAVESAASGATIRNLWDALWYSVITLTTVGYGDLSPVTPMGRVLGILLALGSIGVLSALITLILSMIRGQFIPRMRLARQRGRDWYIFVGENEDALTLAAELKRNHPESVPVFLAADPNEEEGAFTREETEKIPESVCLRASVPEVLGIRKADTGQGISLLFMGRNEWDNLERASEAAALWAQYPGAEIYCMTRAGEDPARDLPTTLHMFSREECVSRRYWKESPLSARENCLVMIGCGRIGAELLSRALLINVFETGRQTDYHVFGDTSGFRQTHPEIMRALSADQEGAGCGGDTLRFYEGSWKEERELLERADRIFICSDSPDENLEIFAELRRWFVTGARVQVYLPSRMPGIPSFGTGQEVITEEFVMKGALNRQAEMLHRIYSEGTKNPVPFDELNDFARQSNIAAADHLPVKVRQLLKDETLKEASPEACRAAYEAYLRTSAEDKDRMQEMEHRRWMRFHQLYNWQYAPVRDNSRRRHPMLLPYEQLSASEQAKDSYAWELLGRFGQEE